MRIFLAQQKKYHHIFKVSLKGEKRSVLKYSMYFSSFLSFPDEILQWCYGFQAKDAEHQNKTFRLVLLTPALCNPFWRVYLTCKWIWWNSFYAQSCYLLKHREKKLEW